MAPRGDDELKHRRNRLAVTEESCQSISEPTRCGSPMEWLNPEGGTLLPAQIGS